MTTLDVESVDLAALARVLHERLGDVFFGNVVGRTQMRDVIADHLGCSALEAELLVDTMISLGHVKLEKAEDGREAWRVSSSG